MIRTSVKIDGVQISNHDLTSLSLYQEVGMHHAFEIRFNRDAGRSMLYDYCNKYIGSAVTIGFDHIENDALDGKSATDYFKGVVTGVSIAASDGTNSIVLHGQSRTVHLDDGPNSRSFENMGMQEIVDVVTGPYKSKFPKGVTVQPRNSEVIPYTVQYRESNFNFLQRLASRYGDWFYYDGFELVFGKPSSEAAVELSFGEGGLQTFDLNVHTAAAQVNLLGYDYTTNKIPAKKASGESASNVYGKNAQSLAKSKIFTEPNRSSIGHQEADSVLANLAERHQEIAEDDLVVASGSSQVSTIKLGGRIRLVEKEIGEDHGEFVITRLAHHIGQGGWYSNDFTAVPAEKKSPPVMTSPTPPFCETQMARVLEVDDPESLGRVVVEFIWQSESGGQSPWLRVMTPYTGKDRGMFITPEAGDMVLVAFENNDADRPYVIGGMYHKGAKPEWFTPDNYIKGFKTRTGNELQFDDKLEKISMKAPKEILIQGDEKVEIRTNSQASSSLTIDVGQGKLIIKAGEIVIESKGSIGIDSKSSIDIESLASTTIKAAEAKIEATTTFAAEGKASADLKGGTVNVSGQAATIVKGGIIKLN